MHVFIKTKIRKNWTAYCNNILFFTLFFSSAIDSAKFYEIAAIWCWVTLFLMSAYFYINNPNKILKKIIFLECHQSVKQFWFRSDQTFSLAWFGSNCLQRLSANNKSHHLLGTELTLCLLMFSVDNLCKQFGPRSGPTKHWAWSRSSYPNCFTLMVFLKEIFKQAKGLTVFSTEIILASSWLTLKATDCVPIIVNCVPLL